MIGKLTCFILTGCIFLMPFITYTQTRQLTLQECYLLSKENYPLIKQHELIVKGKEYSIEKASMGYLPHVSISAQATYQSDVTQIPIKVPGGDLPTLSKDQYKLYGEVNQTIYDWGIIRQQKNSEEANALVEEKKLEVELFKLKERINQLFFGILLIEEQLKQNDILKKDLHLGIDKAIASIQNGVVLKSSGDVLKADLLKANQRTTELKAGRKAYTEMLSLFINQTIEDSTILIKPDNLAISNEIVRPELAVFEYLNRTLKTQERMLAAKNRPKLNFFLQAGFGRPALNFLSNSFDSYYIGGLRLNWTLSGFYTLSKEKAIIDLNRRNLEIQKETFLFNTNYILRQQNVEITKLQELLQSDEQIIELRNNVKRSHVALIENGVIMTSDYLREVNAEDNARQNKILHEIQLLMAQYNQQTTTGK